MKVWKRFRGFVWDVNHWFWVRRGPECTLGVLLHMRYQEGLAWRDVFTTLAHLAEVERWYTGEALEGGILAWREG